MSASRPKQAIEKALQDKGFCTKPGDHNYFVYHTEDGKKTRVVTKTSHGRKPKTISGDLLAFMARQCKLKNDEFLSLVDCPLTRPLYEEILNEKDLL